MSLGRVFRIEKRNLTSNLHFLTFGQTVYVYLRADERWSKSEYIKETLRKREQRETVRQTVFKHLWRLCLGLVPSLVSNWFNWAMATHPHWSRQQKKTPFDMAHTGVNLMITSENKLKPTHAVARLCAEVTFHMLAVSTCFSFHRNFHFVESVDY